MEETEKKPAPDVTPQEAKAEQFDGRNPHETQMDDLFGDMRREPLKFCHRWSSLANDPICCRAFGLLGNSLRST